MKPVINRTYDSRSAFERDAAKLFKKGYLVSSIAFVPGHTLWGHTVLKWITVAGILMGPTRTKGKIIAVYSRPTLATHPAPSFAI